MTRRLKVVVEADGGARGNPGPAGWGAVVREADTGQVLLERAEAIGTATNNVAEYEGLIAGLQAAADLGATDVDVKMDSKLVIEQMAGRWKIKHPGLRPLAAKAAALVRRFQAVTWTWVPRESNRDADRLANEAMDGARQQRQEPRGSGPRGSSPGKAPGPAGGPDGPAQTSAVEHRAGAGAWEPPTGPATRLILVRHGATGLTAQRRYSGRGDVPLSEAGYAQADAVGKRVAALAPGLAAVVSSPLVRCTATAAAIAAAVGGVPVVTDDDLVECDFGEWEGHTGDEIRARWPSEFVAWQRSTAVAPPDGESFRQVATRVRRAAGALRVAYPAAAVVVVSHVSPLKLMLRDALGATDALLRRLFLDPGGISVLDIYPDGAVAVRGVNDTSHLPGGAGISGTVEA